MADEKSLFQTTGLSWSERASLGGLNAVLAPQGSEQRNRFLHGVHNFGATRALRYLPRDGAIVDFGCGTGRFTNFFASHHRHLVCTEVTPEMLTQAAKDCHESHCQFVLTDGVALPLASASMDGVWCCAVLRYSLFVPNPAYAQIAKEMYRVLRPGAYVVNCEMCVDNEPDVFLPGFENAGFALRSISVLQRYGLVERMLSYRLIPKRCVKPLGSICAFVRSRVDNPRRRAPGLRDYLFVWQKPVGAKADRMERSSL